MERSTRTTLADRAHKKHFGAAKYTKTDYRILARRSISHYHTPLGRIFPFSIPPQQLEYISVGATKEVGRWRHLAESFPKTYVSFGIDTPRGCRAIDLGKKKRSPSGGVIIHPLYTVTVKRTNPYLWGEWPTQHALIAEHTV